MEIAFSTRELRDLCELEATAIELLGVSAADALKNRLSDIHAADHIQDVLAGRPRNVRSGTNDYYQLDLADQYVLTVTANHAEPRISGDGKTDWPRVRRVKVMSVEK